MTKSYDFFPRLYTRIMQFNVLNHALSNLLCDTQIGTQVTYLERGKKIEFSVLTENRYPYFNTRRITATKCDILRVAFFMPMP